MPSITVLTTEKFRLNCTYVSGTHTNITGLVMRGIKYLAQRVTNDVYSTTKNINVLVRTFFIWKFKEINTLNNHKATLGIEPGPPIEA